MSLYISDLPIEVYKVNKYFFLTYKNNLLTNLKTVLTKEFVYIISVCVIFLICTCTLITLYFVCLCINLTTLSITLQHLWRIYMSGRPWQYRNFSSTPFSSPGKDNRIIYTGSRSIHCFLFYT